MQSSLSSLLTVEHSHRTRIPCTMAHSYVMQVVLSLLFLLDTAPVILSERILSLGKDEVNTPSITVCVNMSLGFLHI